ncbi:Ribonuclease H domain [Arabidopsis suecica]|uniref:serine C-palmitoyltransferase n=1 Tax=Arabidopsis suecica TaxID=45249 RepID=A0A8T1ZZJ8_ARASU|nr:Ribonuclease H domain [Arabidopsis suecica]
MEPIMRHLLGLFLGIFKEGGDGMYLGLPECFSGSKCDLLAYITKKLKTRLTGWYAKTLSLGGKEVLLKSVAMALPVYAVSCFRLTKYQCQQITSAMTSFWWNSCEEKKKMHWVSWEKMCKTRKEGGLGFRDVGDFNQALLAKQVWRLLTKPNSLLARVYKARYYHRKGFMDAAIGARPSYAWRSIIHGRDLLEKGLIKDIGSWNHPLLSELFFPPDVVRIMSFPPNIASSDSYVWAYNRSGCYTVKSGNWLISHLKHVPAPIPDHEQESRALKAKIWEVKTIPKIKMFLWRVLSGALAVSVCLQAHGMNSDPQCSMCQDAIESISHVLFNCWPAREVWESIRMAIPWILWGIWKHRNEVLYAGKQCDLNALVIHAMEEAEEWNKIKEVQPQTSISTVPVLRRESRWVKPPIDFLKCNLHISWINDSHMCGGAWIVRNHQGDAVFHAREMFLPASNRIAAELRGMLWVLSSLSDLHLDNIEIWSDCSAAIEAIIDPSNWPRYHSYLDKVHRLISSFGKILFKVSSTKGNSVARDIAMSVTREGRTRSYFARGGPAWLHSRAPNTWVDLFERYADDNNKTLKRTTKTSRCLNFGFYNYLEFGSLDEYCTPRVIESLKKFSASTCSSRIDAGTTSVHEELEECVAKFVGQPAAVVFGMGYLTNSAIIPGGLISDSLNHISIINGARGSGATIRVFQHNTPAHLERVLKEQIAEGQPRTHRPWKKIIVVVEGIYSMEGEICHLPEIVSICKKYKAYVYLDEAHSIGAIGKTGRGVCELLGVDTSDVDIMMGTFTKSFGSCGGYIAGSKDLIQYLKYHCPAHLYATSISTPAAQQVISVIKVILGEDASNRGAQKLVRIRENSNFFRFELQKMGFDVLGDNDSPVMPIMLYNPAKIAAFSRACLQENLAVVVVSFPAIPLLLARARICISASHSREDLIKALQVILRRVHSLSQHSKHDLNLPQKAKKPKNGLCL